MKMEVQQFQADMMTKGAFTRRERRQIKYLSPGNREQHRVVRETLPRQHMARRWMENCGEVDDWGNIDYCGVPLCPRCHLRERGVQTGKAIKKVFAGAENEDLAFATILLPVQLDFSGMTDLLENEKRRLRTFIDRQRKKDARWYDFQLRGWWEIDRMSFGDFESSGRNTRIALDDLEFPLMQAPDKTIWRPHLHAIIRKGRLTTEEITRALRKETHSGKYQVDIQPFRAHREVATNIQNVVRYCLKFRIECDYKRPDAQDFIEADIADSARSMGRNWWPAEDIRDYVDWLCVERRGFQSLRVVIGRAKSYPANDMRQAPPSNRSIAEEIRDGEASLNSMSDRIRSEENVGEMNGHAVAWDVNGIFAVEDSHAVSGCGAGVSALGNSVTRCVYNNNIQDTNWTNDGRSGRSPFDESGRFTGNGVNSGETSKYAGNVISLAERLHRIGVF
ncbi:MAG: hypothetical protein BGO06_12980 [Shinella sp. 65-6]|nr:MAG: hypothetical protein BGO06_12980 [Shinella sp. 65-6]